MILTYVTVTKAHKTSPELSVLNKSVLFFYVARKKGKLGEDAKNHLVSLGFPLVETPANKEPDL